MTNNLLTMCAGCERIKVDGKWFERDSYSDYDEMVRTQEINCDYCPECVKLYRKEQRKLKQMYSALRN